MGSKVYYSPFIPTFSGNGLPVANAKLYFFYTGTTDLAPIFQDAALTIPMENPVISDGAARYPNIYLDEDITYRVRETGPDGTPLAADIDPYIPGMAVVVVPDLPEFAAPTGSTLVGHGDSTVAAELRVSVLKYGAVGDGVIDDTDAIQDAIDDNLGGLIVLPAGYNFFAAGVILSGSAYNGTKILIEGGFLLVPSGGGNNWTPEAPMWGGIFFHDVEDFGLACPGLMNGNRANQSASQQHYLAVVLGGRNGSIPLIRGKEMRGDLLMITNKDHYQASTNSSGLQIGQIQAWNSADDGRHALSIISCSGLDIDSILSRNVGGVIDGERMPGGFDIEPDGAYHLVEDVTVGNINVVTAGVSGVAVLGQSLTGVDATEDWNVRRISIANFQATMTGGHGGPNFIRTRALDVTGHCHQTVRGQAYNFDRLNGVRARVSASGVAIGAAFGKLGYVRDYDISLRVDDHNDIACLAYGLNRGTLRLGEHGPQGAGSYGVGLAHTPVEDGVPVPRAITLTDVVFDVDIPYDGNLSGAILVTADAAGGSITFGEGTHVKGSMTGYIGGAGAALQFITRCIPSRNVEGRHIRAAVPPVGLWLAGEIIYKTDTAAGGSPGWYVTTGGTAGVDAVFKALAAVAA